MANWNESRLAASEAIVRYSWGVGLYEILANNPFTEAIFQCPAK